MALHAQRGLTERRAPSPSPAGSPSTWTRAEFARRITPHLPKLHRLCLVLSWNETEAEDLLQSALVKAYVHRASFEERGSLLAWLYGIVRHEQAEVGRTAQRRRHLLEAALDRAGDLLDGMTDGPDPARTPERVAMVHEEAELLLSCLRQVEEPYRSVVHLCDVEELGYDEVARILHVPVGTVKSRHARGRAKLRERFEAASSVYEPAGVEARS